MLITFNLCRMSVIYNFLNCQKQAWAERLRYWNSLETAQKSLR